MDRVLDFRPETFPLSVAFGLAFVLHIGLRFRAKLENVAWLPGLRCLFSPTGLAAALSHSWWNPTMTAVWYRRKILYKNAESETITIVPLFGVPTILTSNLDVTRQIIGGGHSMTFIKPEWANGIWLRWGANLVGIDGGDHWRRHRRIAGPAFNTEVYKYVWTESLRVFHEMSDSPAWADRKEVSVDSIQDVMFKLTLLIIARCSFGFQFTYENPPCTETDSMSVQEAFDIMAHHHILTGVVPSWVLRLPFEICRQTAKALEVVGKFMREQVQERRAELHAEGTPPRKDLFSMLLISNEDESKKNRLNDQELIGNVHAMLLAGHETAAGSLSTTFAFLAVHQDIQEEIYEQVASVIPPSHDPAFEDYDKLNKVLAALYESIRLYPPAYLMVREATEDTTLKLPNPVGQEGDRTIAIPKGTMVVADVVGLQYNPRYHRDPEVFNPSRWYDSEAAKSPDAFSAFSVGQRICVGRKFATTEMVAFLAMFLRNYRWEPLLRPGETLEGWKERVFSGGVFLTLAVTSASLRFVRR